MAKLREVVLVHFSTRLGGMSIVAATIAVERTEQAMGHNHITHAPETAGRTFFINKEHGVVLAGGVIHGDDQVPLLADDPFVGAAILMNHHAG